MYFHTNTLLDSIRTVHLILKYSQSHLYNGNSAHSNFILRHSQNQTPLDKFLSQQLTLSNCMELYILLQFKDVLQNNNAKT